MSEIKFSPESISDLKEIRKYISDDLENKVAADNTVALILEEIKSLSTFPKSGSPLSSIVKISTDYRYIACKNYMVFYRCENDAVYVSRILYGKMNYMKVLFGDIDEE